LIVAGFHKLKIFLFFTFRLWIGCHDFSLLKILILKKKINFLHFSSSNLCLLVNNSNYRGKVHLQILKIHLTWCDR
jgi:hypothetical protein